MVAACNICNRLAHRSCPSGFCEKYHVQSTELWSSISVKKTLDLPWTYPEPESEKWSLIKAFYGRRSISLLTSSKFFEFLSIANLQAFLVNDRRSISQNVAQSRILVRDMINLLY